MSEYLRSPRKQKEDAPCRHKFSLCLDRHARAGLAEYVQATQCSQAQAVRAIFRCVLTGEVFGTPRRAGRSGAIPVPRDPQAAAMQFPNLFRESLQKKLDRSTGYTGRGFASVVLGVAQISVMLDDAAKEGLIYTMRRLNKNHADAARWLLANVRVPGVELKVPLRPNPGPAFVSATSGRRISSYPPGKYDPRWDD